MTAGVLALLGIVLIVVLSRAVISMTLARAQVVVVWLAAASATMAGLQKPTAAVDPSPVGDVVTPDGIRLHYEINGKGPTIVVLHGGPGLSSAYLAPNLDVLAGHYRLISYDQRGAGRSTVVTDPAKLSRDHHVEDIEAVRHQFGLEKVVLLGHSWGAAPVAFYAKAHPDRVAAVILLDPIPARSEPWMGQAGTNLRLWMDEATSKHVAALAAARRGASDPVAACRAYWAVFIRGYMADPNDKVMLGRMRGDVCDAPPEAIVNTGVVSSAALGANGWDWREQFHGTDAPVLILHGDRDPIPLASAREWENAFPRATLLPIEGAGHFPFIEQPQAFLRAIQQFITAHPPSP